MDLLPSFLEVIKDIALPVLVALITARVTLRAGWQQINAQASERFEARENEALERQEDFNRSAMVIRGDVLESISDSIDDFAEELRKQVAPTTTAVKRALFRLSSRCSAEHLADHCRAYVDDAALDPDQGQALEAMLEIRRRLLGWHLGHLSLKEVDRLVQDGREETRKHLAARHPEIPLS